MDFGLCLANKGEVYDEGPFAGLGSHHIRGAWPLGYFQEFILCRDDRRSHRWAEHSAYALTARFLHCGESFRLHLLSGSPHKKSFLN